MHPSPLVRFFISSNLVSPSSAESIAATFSHKTIEKNNFLLTEGKICDNYIFLQSGFMRAFAHDTEGREVTTNFYSGGQVVFEVSSFFNRTRSKENIQALTDCEGWHINYEQLNGLFHSMPEFRDFGRSVLVKGFAALKNRMLNTITETAEQRYTQLLQANPEILQYAPLKHIASYLGITDTSLSRIRKEMTVK
ncbi:MAG: Crp/Fnr family transcriptional regulator [Bacteroidota bacterium]